MHGGDGGVVANSSSCSNRSATTSQRVVLIRLTFGKQCFSACCAIGHLPGSPDLHGTKGNVHGTVIGRPVAAAAAVPQRELRGRLRQLFPLYDENSATMK